MDALNRSIVFTQLVLTGALDSMKAKRDERGGSTSIEQLVWIALAIAIGVIVTAAIIAFVRSKLP